MNQPAEMIVRLFTAFNARDIDAVLAGFDPEVDWPNVSNGTRLHGHAQVRAYWESQFATINPTVEPLNVTTDDADVVVAVRQVIRDLEGNLLVDAEVEHRYTFHNGLVARMDVASPGGGAG